MSDEHQEIINDSERIRDLERQVRERESTISAIRESRDLLQDQLAKLAAIAQRALDEKTATINTLNASLLKTNEALSTLDKTVTGVLERLKTTETAISSLRAQRGDFVFQSIFDIDRRSKERYLSKLLRRTDVATNLLGEHASNLASLALQVRAIHQALFSPPGTEGKQ